MFSQLDINRFKSIFKRILDKRLVSLVEAEVFNIMKRENFTGYYKEEIVGNDSFIRPIFYLNEYSMIIVCLIEDELNNEEFIDEFNLDILPLNKPAFYLWLQSFLVDNHIKFSVNGVSKDGKIERYVFYTMLILDYHAICKEGYEFLLGK